MKIRNTKTLLRAAAAFAILSTAAAAQAPRPDFSGRWVFEPGGPGGPAQAVEEQIQHEEPKLVITSTTASGTQFTIRLSTDGKESPNIVAGREMTSKTTWDGGKLVTVVRDPQGMQFTEVRSLSEDGETQTVQGFMDLGRTRPMFQRVARKQK